MVSRIPYPHPLTQFVRGQRSFAHLIATLFGLVVIYMIWFAIPLLCLLFVLTPPARYLWDLARHRHTRPESLF
jgi:hypothetical protein